MAFVQYQEKNKVGRYQGEASDLFVRIYHGSTLRFSRGVIIKAIQENTPVFCLLFHDHEDGRGRIGIRFTDRDGNGARKITGNPSLLKRGICSIRIAKFLQHFRVRIQDGAYPLLYDGREDLYIFHYKEEARCRIL